MSKETLLQVLVYGDRRVVQIPQRYVRVTAQRPNGKLTPHGGAWIKGALARAAGRKCRHPYSEMSLQGRGFAKAWRAGWESMAMGKPESDNFAAANQGGAA
jgi:hypothetical protein